MLFTVCFIALAAVSTVQSFAISSRQNGSDERIWGGSTTTIDKVPWRVQVLTHKPEGYTGNCAGTILSPEWVLTAAHCFKAYDAANHKVVVYSGAEGWRKGKASPVKYFKTHNGYDKTVQSFDDIALVQLQTPLELSTANKRVAACLREDPTDQDINGGLTVLAAGWGIHENGNRADQLRSVEFKTIANSLCVQYYPDKIKDSQVCAFETPKDVCGGDSGSTIDIIEDGKAYAVGIVSYGPSQPCGSAPGVYTRVSSYKKWIEDITGPLTC